MGHVILVFGTLVVINLGLGYAVSDYLYEDEQKEGVVEIQEVSPEDAAATPEVSTEKAE